MLLTLYLVWWRCSFRPKMWTKFFLFLPRLSGETPARYDLRLNVNLYARVGNSQRARPSCGSVLALCLTMTTEEIVNFYTAREKNFAKEIETIEKFIETHGSKIPSRRKSSLKEKIRVLAMSDFCQKSFKIG